MLSVGVFFFIAQKGFPVAMMQDMGEMWGTYEQQASAGSPCGWDSKYLMGFM